MASRAGSHPRHREGYFHATRRPVNSLVFVAPLLGFFHAGALLHDSDVLAPRLVQQFLQLFGASAAYLPPLLVVVVLLLQQAARRDGWKVQPGALAGMLAESAVYTAPLIALSYFTGRIVTAAAGTRPAGGAILKQMFQAAGAGIYEEFLFRLVLVGLVLLVFVDLLELNRRAVALAAAVASGLLFSAAHFEFAGMGAARPFDWSPFLFLAAAGAFWGVLYVKRGFAVAVGSHILWDVYVVLTAT